MENKQFENTDFFKLAYGDDFVKDMDLAFSCYSEVYRLYVKKDDHQGFKAVAIYNPNSDNTQECWESEGNGPMNVDVIFTASACFDGVRHMSFNPEIHHPSLERLTEIFSALRDIEESTCPDAD